MYLNMTSRSLGAVGPQPDACKDAGTGLLIDCWNAAQGQGLGLLIDQSQLSRLSAIYERVGNQVRNRNRRQGLNGVCGLGDDAPMTVSTDIAPDWLQMEQNIGPYAGTEKAKPISSIITSEIATLPTITAENLMKAALLPNAPAIVKQAATQYGTAHPSMAQPTLSAGSGGSADLGWFTQQMIGGIPNYLLLGGGAIVLVLLLGRRKR